MKDYLPSLIILLLIFVCISLALKIHLEKKASKKLVRKNSRLIADNALLETEQLKFQLQPHTLRNMIATLHVSAKNLYKGSEALVNTLDYVLHSSSKHCVSIKDEITFLESYKNLQGIFVHQINTIRIDKSQVNENCKFYNSECIPHLITAYFIENAFKHGDVNHPDFLNIDLKLCDKSFEMNVVNRINPNTYSGKGGLGLKNMKQRLELFHTGKYEMQQMCNEEEYYSKLTIRF